MRILALVSLLVVSSLGLVPVTAAAQPVAQRPGRAIIRRPSAARLVASADDGSGTPPRAAPSVVPAGVCSLDAETRRCIDQAADSASRHAFERLEASLMARLQAAHPPAPPTPAPIPAVAAAPAPPAAPTRSLITAPPGVRAPVVRPATQVCTASPEECACRARGGSMLPDTNSINSPLRCRITTVAVRNLSARLGDLVNRTRANEAVIRVVVEDLPSLEDEQSFCRLHATNPTLQAPQGMTPNCSTIQARLDVARQRALHPESSSTTPAP